MRTNSNSGLSAEAAFAGAILLCAGMLAPPALAQAEASEAPVIPVADPAQAAGAPTIGDMIHIAESAPAPAVPMTRERFIDLTIAREAELAQTMRSYRPLVETYIQLMAPHPRLGAVPDNDRYFLGKLDLSQGVTQKSLIPSPGMGRKVLEFFQNLYMVTFGQDGFSRMILLDPGDFNRENYEFSFVHREFLGEVRAMVFEVTPKDPEAVGRFIGRIWVEDEAQHIVRYNGAFTVRKGTDPGFHFDGWRLPLGPDGTWLPGYVYSEESYYVPKDARPASFKSQTRLWGYAARSSEEEDEFTKVVVDAPVAEAEGASDLQDLSPVASRRAWEKLAESNVLHRMEKSGLLAPAGPVDEVLDTVITNLVVTNNLDIQPPVRGRVLLTTPLESFTVGHTIVLSRGLVDVLPDEASLALVLASELAHIELGHSLDTKYAFSDRMLFDDEETLSKFGFKRDSQEQIAADLRAAQILDSSPYKDKLAGAGLFLRELRARADSLPALIRPHFGNRFFQKSRLYQSAKLMKAAPALREGSTEQIAALPLGGRVKVDPWSGATELLRNRPVALLTAREKMPFEVTPLMPMLQRFSPQQIAAGKGRAAGSVGVAQSVPSAEAATAAGAGAVAGDGTPQGATDDPAEDTEPATPEPPPAPAPGA